MEPSGVHERSVAHQLDGQTVRARVPPLRAGSTLASPSRATVTDAWQPCAVHIQTGYHACTANEPVNHGGGDTAANSTRFGLGALDPVRP